MNLPPDIKKLLRNMSYRPTFTHFLYNILKDSHDIFYTLLIFSKIEHEDFVKLDKKINDEFMKFETRLNKITRKLHFEPRTIRILHLLEGAYKKIKKLKLSKKESYDFLVEHFKADPELQGCLIIPWIRTYARRFPNLQTAQEIKAQIYHEKLISISFSHDDILTLRGPRTAAIKALKIFRHIGRNENFSERRIFMLLQQHKKTSHLCVYSRKR